jgi:hypothetical protein
MNWDLGGTLGAGVPGIGDVAAFSANVPAYHTATDPTTVLTQPVNQTPFVDPSTNGTVGSLWFDASWTGTLTVNSPLSVSGVSEWDGGSINIAGGVTLTNTGSLTLNRPSGSDVFDGAGTLANAGTITQAGPGSLQITAGTLCNQSGAVHVFAGDSGLTGGGTVTNAGTFRKTADGGAASTINSGLTFNCNGTIDVRQGTLAIAAGGTNTGGTFNVESGATLDLTGGNVVSYSGVYVGTYSSGVGTILLGSGTLRLAGNVNFLFPAGMWKWSAGTIDTNQFTLTNAGSLTLNNPSSVQDLLSGGGTLQNATNGVIDQTGLGGVAIATGSSGLTTLANAGFYNISADAGIVAGAGGGAVTNSGTLQKTAGNGTSILNPAVVSNTGTVFASSGTLDIEGAVQVSGVSLTAGSWGAATPATLMLNGGAPISNSSATITLVGSGATFANIVGKLTGNTGAFSLLDGANHFVSSGAVNSGALTVGGGSSFTAVRLYNTSAGAITGDGSISAAGGAGPPGFFNYGQLTPGGPTGPLSVTGPFNQQYSGTFNVQLNGATPGTQFSQLRVNGSVSLSGALNVTAGFVAPIGSQYEIIENDGSGPVSGGFDGITEGSGISVGHQFFTISYQGGDGNDVVLTAVQPHPPTIAGIIIGDGTSQRSEVRVVSVIFSEQVKFAGGDVTSAFQVTNAVYGATVSLVGVQVLNDALNRTVVNLHFAGIETDPVSTDNGAVASLADGRYQLTVFGNRVSSFDNELLDGAGIGQSGSNYVTPPDPQYGGPGLGFYRLFGDVNGDGVVDSVDLGQFRTTFNASNANSSYIGSLDANNDGVVDSVDLGQFRTRFNSNVWSFAQNPQFYVNPATGNDANDGRSPQTAWASWGRLVTAVQDGTIPAGTWVDNNGAAADLSTIPSVQNKSDWYAAYQAGDRHVTGGIVNIDTSLAPLQVTAPLVMPPGTEIRSATDQLTNLQVNVPLAATEVWTQPDATDDPDVWGTTTTSYAATVLYEQQNGQWVQLLPIGASAPVTSLSAALPLLEANPGSFFVDPSTNQIYTHSLEGGNPNTDGVARQYVPTWASLSASRIVDVPGGMALRIGGDGGFGFDPTTSVAEGANGIGSGEWGAIAVIDSCEWSRAGKHTFSAVGNLGAGLVIFRDDVAEQGPGGVSPGNWSHFVDYTSFAGTGTIVSIYDGCSTVDGWQNVDAPGGSDANPGYTALIEHTNGFNTAFAQRLLMNCTFNGIASIGTTTAAVQATNCNFNGGVASDALVTLINGGSIGYHLPSLGGSTSSVSTLNGVNLQPGTVFVGGPQFSSQLMGRVNLVGCNLDLADGNIYSTAWGRVAPLTLTMTNCIVSMNFNAAYGLVYSWQSSDTLSITGSTFTGNRFWPLFINYNNNPSAIVTWQMARDQGQIDGTNVINGGAWQAD